MCGGSLPDNRLFLLLRSFGNRLEIDGSRPWRGEVPDVELLDEVNFSFAAGLGGRLASHRRRPRQGRRDHVRDSAALELSRREEGQ